MKTSKQKEQCIFFSFGIFRTPKYGNFLNLNRFKTAKKGKVCFRKKENMRPNLVPGMYLSVLIRSLYFNYIFVCMSWVWCVLYEATHYTFIWFEGYYVTLVRENK